MQFLQGIAHRLGALPARRVTWGLVLFFSIWVVLDVFVLKLSGGVAQSSYDAMVRARLVAAAPDPRIVIVDIDEASLARMGKEFGRWPWPRDTLATVLQHIEAQQPAAVVWDILFSDADRLSPGGDAAFNEAVRRSQRSHFSVVRLPRSNDSASQITRAALPGLWLLAPPSPNVPPPVAGESTVAKAATVALIPPALPAVASARLGFNNGYVDQDGVLRRYRFVEPLADGTAIQSIAASVLSATNLDAYKDYSERAGGAFDSRGELISWRKRGDAYPHISFADVFEQAEGVKPVAGQSTFAGKVVIVGATAPSLHDIHPSPLSNMQAGVDSLATVIDNALNRRHLHELPRWLQAGLAIALCVGLALWVQFKSVASLVPALLALPAALLGIGYLSLNGLPVFLDLHLAAGLALVFLAVLRYWNTLRRNYWCSPPSSTAQALAIWPWERSDAWLEGALDRLIDAVERHAPTCRVVVCDANVIWPATLRWPELARFAAVVGPQEAVLEARDKLEPALRRLARRSGEPVLLDSSPNRAELAKTIFMVWATFQKTDTNQESRPKG
ncbi:CHASE2 domain-containing protein [Rhodoferax sp.]|uniref:CHASE2 domain-containing protein n=1 Tax=Rhodoferax sp. TaxID=50421 RepID=UPI001EB71D8B|nr:CHASE2 domain-containing protein [Rhodoferax sp.]MBT9505215.1 CHASE2 domain-containing protein [Rhodoferax sp.]